MTELTEEQIIEELSSTEAVEVAMIEAAVNEIGQLGGATIDKGFVEEDGEFYGSYCIEVLDNSEEELSRSMARLGYTEIESDDHVRGFVRGKIVAMFNVINQSVFVYVDYNDDAEDEVDELPETEGS